MNLEGELAALARLGEEVQALQGEQDLLSTRLLALKHQIRDTGMFLGLLDPDPLVRCMGPDPDPSIIKQM